MNLGLAYSSIREFDGIPCCSKDIQEWNMFTLKLLRVYRVHMNCIEWKWALFINQ